MGSKGDEGRAAKRCGEGHTPALAHGKSEGRARRKAEVRVGEGCGGGGRVGKARQSGHTRTWSVEERPIESRPGSPKTTDGARLRQTKAARRLEPF